MPRELLSLSERAREVGGALKHGGHAHALSMSSAHARSLEIASSAWLALNHPAVMARESSA